MAFELGGQLHRRRIANITNTPNCVNAHCALPPRFSRCSFRKQALTLGNWPKQLSDRGARELFQNLVQLGQRGNTRGLDVWVSADAVDEHPVDACELRATHVG